MTDLIKIAPNRRDQSARHPNDRDLADEVEIAAAFGFRDRVLGIDSGERASTMARFQGCLRLEDAYRAGWTEADHYCSNCAKWGWDAGRALAAA